MRTTKLAAICLGMLIHSYASCAITEALPDGYLASIPTGTDNKRVGNALLVKVGWSKASSGWSGNSLILVACDGTWISTAIDGSVNIDGKEVAGYQTGILLDSVEFPTAASSELFYASAVVKRAPQLCKTAGKEPRNFALPISASSMKGTEATSTAIVLGTSNRTGSIVELWMRRSVFENKPMLDKDGNAIEWGGVKQTRRVATGKYTLDRQVMDCRARSIASYEWAEYDGISATPKSGSIPREGLKLSNVVPGSVGEVTMDAVCMIYGSER